MKPLFKLNGMYIYDDGEYLRFHIKEPFWSAYSKYHWQDGISGIGIAEAVIKRAESMGRNLKITFYKNRKHRYTITPSLVRKRAEQYGQKLQKIMEEI